MIKGMLSGVLGPIISSFCVLHLPNEDLTVSPTFAIFSVIYFKILSLKEHLFSIVMILLYLLDEESDGLDPEICVMVFTLNDVSTLCIISIV